MYLFYFRNIEIITRVWESFWTRKLVVSILHKISQFKVMYNLVKVRDVYIFGNRFTTRPTL